MMNGYNFTERVRQVLAFARQEAIALAHEYVGTEHILLGVIREGEGVACSVLENLDADAGRLRETVLATLKRGRSQSTGPDLPYTSRAKKVLELAMSEARELSHSYVGTEHLLLGLLREEKGIAAQVLTDAGISIAKARSETLRILGTEMPPEHGGPSQPAWASERREEEPNKIVIEMHYPGVPLKRLEFRTRRDALRFLIG